MVLYGSFEQEGSEVEEETLLAQHRRASKKGWGKAALILVVSGVLLSGTHLSSSGTTSLRKQASATKLEAEDDLFEWFQEPERLHAQNGVLDVTFQVQVGRLSFRNGISFNARTFNKQAPAPTMVIRRGQRLKITVDNQLGPEVDLTAPENSFRSPNTTVIHTHGLHISPAGNADNIFRVIGPGESETFIYDIPRNHPVGTFYVHSHYQGSSAYQQAYSMTAALLVLESPEKEIRVAQDRVMIVGLVDINSGKRTDIIEDSRLSGSLMNLGIRGVNVTGGDRAKFITVNVMENPVVRVQEGTLERWRLVNAVIDGNLLVKVDGSCQMAEIAADGVQYREPRVKKDGALIPPGSRRDLLVHCTAGSAQFYSAIEPYKPFDKNLLAYIGSESNFATGPLVQVQSKPAKNTPPKSFEALLKTYRFSGPRGYTAEPMKDLRNHDAEVHTVVSYMQGGPNTPKAVRNGNQYSMLGFNGQVYNASQVMFQVHLDEKVEWKIENYVSMDGSPALESHPFHMHTNHFQVVSVSSIVPDFTPDFEIGDFRDTVAVPAPGNVTIRWVARDYEGLSVFHCHTLAHEDTGMIANFEILPPK